MREALTDLTGPEWPRARRRLLEPATFTFLDRTHARRATVPLTAEVRAVVVRAEGLRRQPDGLRARDTSGAVRRGVALLAGVVLSLLGETGRQGLGWVRGILNEAWRASSLVDGVNSVLRMHQGRQKRLTPALLTLKRLHGNRHEFAAGRRKGHSPYGRLGRILPEVRWWELLQMPPEQLRQQLSALNPAA